MKGKSKELMKKETEKFYSKKAVVLEVILILFIASSLVALFLIFN